MTDSRNDSKPVVGIDLGGTHMQIGVVDAQNQIIGRTRAKTGADDGLDPVIDRMVAAIEEACNQAGTSIRDLGGVCVGAPSPVDPVKGWMFNAVNLRWRDVPLAEIMSQKLDGIPATIDNDVNVAIWGEYRLGAAAGGDYRNVMGIWVGTGIGGGLVLDGRLHHGSFGTAGEFGQMTQYPGMGPAYAMVEHHGSRTFIIENLQRLMRANRQSVLIDMVEHQLEDLTIAHVADAIAQGDSLAIDVTRHAAEVVGVAAANAVTLLSLDCIVLGGGVTEAVGATYIDWVREAFERTVFPETCRRCVIASTRLADNAGLLGAALLARERLVES